MFKIPERKFSRRDTQREFPPGSWIFMPENTNWGNALIVGYVQTPEVVNKYRQVKPKSWSVVLFKNGSIDQIDWSSLSSGYYERIELQNA